VVKVISQHVDTLKNHYYFGSELSDASFKRFLLVAESAISMKKEVQLRTNEHLDSSEIYLEASGMKFNIMPTSISGFSAVLFNRDVSIAIRRPKQKLFNSPVLKVEFRSEFLARVGYIKALELVNGFVSKALLDSYTIKVSEIHLATDIQGYNFTPLDYYRVKTRSRTSEMFEEETAHAKGSLYGTATSFSGFTFGGGNYRLRVYDKTLETKKYKDKEFAKFHYWENNPDYEPERNVWRIEMQYRREKLKTFQNSDYDILDGYINVLNSIPDIWNKALEDFTIKNVSDVDCFNILRRKRTLKNGTEKILSKNAIYQIFKRADVLPVWSKIKTWNTFQAKPLAKTFKVPYSSSQYVYNSVKSVFSTMAKHYGTISSDALIMAFADANEDTLKKKQKSLLECAIEKQLDYFQKIDFLKSNGVVNLPPHKELEKNIYTIVSKASDSIYSAPLSENFISRYFENEAEKVF